MNWPDYKPPVYTARDMVWAAAVCFAVGLVLGFALCRAALGAPGDVITIQAEVSGSDIASVSAEVSLVVVSPLDTGKPVYAPLAQRRLDPVLFGRTVRVPVSIGQSVDWFNGIQLRGGEVWIDGYRVTPTTGRLR